MSHLTIEKMDKINFLLTEVSLECLGNKFFDIFGNQTNSMLYLTSAKSLQSTSNDTIDVETDLWKTLTAAKKPSTLKNLTKNIEQPVVIQNGNVGHRKRRASFSSKNNETDNDPESLLMPMQSVPKAAKIASRRSTISVQQIAKNRKLAIQTSEHKKINTQNASSQSRTNNIQLENPIPKNIIDIKRHLNRDINIRYNAMRLLQEAQEAKYRTENINPDMKTLYQSQEKKLFAQCNTLIQFIKFIQEDRDNNVRLRNISHAILELQKEY